MVPLSYGIRIGHFALCGGENVFYEQPKDMTELTTPEGWRLRGGHRFWVAPESEKTYCPDVLFPCYKLLYSGYSQISRKCCRTIGIIEHSG